MFLSNLDMLFEMLLSAEDTFDLQHAVLSVAALNKSPEVSEEDEHVQQLVSGRHAEIHL